MATPLVTGLNRLNDLMMNQLMKKIIILMACSMVSLGVFADSPALPEGGRLAEVHVLSLDFQGQQRASMVARPCDKPVKCDNIYVRINDKTTWRDDGKLSTYKKAKKLHWIAAVIVINKHNEALMLNRMLTGSE